MQKSKAGVPPHSASPRDPVRPARAEQQTVKSGRESRHRHLAHQAAQPTNTSVMAGPPGGAGGAGGQRSYSASFDLIAAGTAELDRGVAATPPERDPRVETLPKTCATSGKAIPEC